MYNKSAGKIVLWMLLFYGGWMRAKAQEGCPFFIVQKVCVSGNEKTKEGLIGFESGLKRGDTIVLDALLKKIQDGEANLMRTGLFSKVEIRYELDIDRECNMDIIIRVVENWLLFPFIIFELVDRNFNVWWRDYDADLSRASYGLGLAHNNLTGRKDHLKIKVAAGYTDKYELAFTKPYLGRSKKLDFGMRAGYLEYAEAGYGLKGSKPLFYSHPGTNSLHRIQSGVKISFQPDRKTRYSQEIEWTHHRIDDSLAYMHPDYLLGTRKRQSFIRAYSTYEYNSLNDPVRPRKGFYIKSQLDFIQDFGSRAYAGLQLNGAAAYSFTDRLWYGMSFLAATSFIRGKPAFILYGALGNYQNPLTGYELYLVNGMDFASLEQGIYFSLTEVNKSFFKFLSKEPVIRIRAILDVFAKVTAARVNDPYFNVSNPLANTNLGSLSLGAQCSVNSVIKMDFSYSLNHLGEGALYFHTKKAF